MYPQSYHLDAGKRGRRTFPHFGGADRDLVDGTARWEMFRSREYASQSIGRSVLYASILSLTGMRHGSATYVLLIRRYRTLARRYYSGGPDEPQQVSAEQY